LTIDREQGKSINKVPNTYSYQVRLRRFKNKYNTKINLYKLHGSVDNYLFNLNNKKYEMVKWEYGLDSDSIQKEVTNHLGETFFDRGFVDAAQSFLSGTLTKIKYYKSTYYKDMFEHFIKNLQNSKNLIVIGYSFQDEKINNLLIESFLKDISKMMYVVDIHKPNSEIIENSKCKIIEKSIAEIDYKELFYLIQEKESV